MKKPQSLKGNIFFIKQKATGKKLSVRFADPYSDINYEESISESMISCFENLNLTVAEKQKLSLGHRKKLNYFKHLNVFFLNQDAKKLIEQINDSEENDLVIEAQSYGAYICLAALYSGRISPEKKVEFIIEKAPLALFPKVLIKHMPNTKRLKLTMLMSDDCWLAPFESLYTNEQIKCNFSKIYLAKKAA